MKKVKFFKKVFDENADDVIPSLRTINGVDVTSKKDVQHVMSRETFVSVAGEIYSKAKERYYFKGQAQYFEFADWYAANFDYFLMNPIDIQERFKHWQKHVKNNKK